VSPKFNIPKRQQSGGSKRKSEYRKVLEVGYTLDRIYKSNKSRQQKEAGKKFNNRTARPEYERK